VSGCPTSSYYIKEFPHTDVVARAEDLLTPVLRAVRGEIHPVMSLYDCRQIASYPATLPLMRAFVDKTAAMEGKDGVLSVSIGHCSPMPTCRSCPAGFW
jgi:microcystin degradation protein MlrC